ncbi:MAG: murein biosynthesis integral membrane protein MurJ [Actinobacteria bacterium RBG_16_68_21]|nr:MAG: murein biosynthesis integral membrane protein MurJ [Actinobacteria bacterium RBG_16_68_21]
MSDGHSLYRRMGTAAAIVAGGVLASRILGLVRQIIFAWLLGAGATGDEYFVAFLIPDLLNYLLAGAYMAITLIPILTRRFAAGDEDDARRAFWAVTRPLAIGITALVLIAMPFVGSVLRAVEPGFTDAQVANAARLTRIVLPAQVFFILGQLFTAWQFSREKFLIPTLGPIVYNVGIIVGGLIGGLGRSNPSAEGFAWGALCGAFLGIFVLQWWGAHRQGLHLPTAPIRRHPAVRRYFALAIPLMLGQSLVVLDEQLGRTFGSLHENGGVSWLTFGRQTMLVPVGVIAQAAGVAAYPFLARLAAEGKHVEMARAVGRAIRYVIAFSLAAAAGLIALAIPIVRTLYERGSFDAADTIMTAGTVILFALGVPMWGIQQILARGFYAREEMWTPVVAGTLTTAAAVPIYWALNRALGVDGLALASSVSITLYTAVLAVAWYRRTDAAELRPVARTAGLTLPLAAVGGALGWGSARLLVELLGAEGFIANAAAVVFGGLVVVAVTLGLPALRRDLRRT